MNKKALKEWKLTIFKFNFDFFTTPHTYFAGIKFFLTLTI